MAHDRLEPAREDNFEEPAIRQQVAGAQLWHMPCLVERMFRTPVEAQRALNAFARPHGYDIVYKGTSYDKRHQKRLIRYGCDRHGVPRSQREHFNPPKRTNVSSRKCGCPMEVYLVRTTGNHGDIGWLLQHRGRAGQHNHPPSSHAASHPMHRRASHTEAARLAVAVDGETGATARQTIARLLVEDPGLLLVPRDVYNERARATRAALGGLSRIKRLLQKLQDGPFQVSYQYDEHHHLTHLFFAHNDAIDIYRTNYDVIIMDCTYRTNRFNMPLFNIVGVTGMNTTIHIAQVFLIGEEEQDFQWALRQLEHLLSQQGIPPPQVFLTDRDLALLNALEEVFPDTPALLCLWHIMKDVQAHARRVSFPREIDPDTSLLQDSGDHQTFCEAFLRVVYAPTEEDYLFRRHELHLLSAVEATHIDDVWLDIWKRRIVRRWTDQVLHFGMHATSRVEGYHATLKSWLGTSSGDLLTVHTRMEHWWRQSIERHWVLHPNAEVYVPIRLRGKWFAAVIRVIHTHALLHCVESLQRMKTLLKPCTGSYEMTWGIPCGHSLHQRVATCVGLRPTDFHPHWWIRRHQAPLELPARILEPERIEDRRARRALERRARRHAAGNGPRGTRRIPANFEVYSNE
ncbi:hypothetical protein PR001_g19771 [Phytophthora rubi]|uniref:MULE transposase domain-containing protein n=1 Tax=Phytophthora rubi TaxID=129364 RepID=A0A6A3JNN0_9STRA|nr:hypothetical protein PR001_g19771 [Phytophthora rubi]